MPMDLSVAAIWKVVKGLNLSPAPSKHQLNNKGKQNWPKKSTSSPTVSLPINNTTTVTISKACRIHSRSQTLSRVLTVWVMKWSTAAMVCQTKYSCKKLHKYSRLKLHSHRHGMVKWIHRNVCLAVATTLYCSKRNTVKWSRKHANSPKTETKESLKRTK